MVEATHHILTGASVDVHKYELTKQPRKTKYPLLTAR